MVVFEPERSFASGGEPVPRRLRFASWDKDGNGTISKEEFDARPRFGGRGAGFGRDERDLPQN